MRKTLAVALFLLSFALWSDDNIPSLGPRSILTYYKGWDNGAKYMDFNYICSRAGEGLRVVRNEILAKYGRPFKSHDLREHFEKSSWYATNPAYHDGLLTGIDNENIRRVQAVENGLPGNSPLLRDLISGKPIQAAGGEIKAGYSTRDRQFIFTLAHKTLEYVKDIKIPFNAKSNRVENGEGNNFMFTYNGSYQIVVAVSTGIHGEETMYFTISFKYNQKTRTMYDIHIPDAGY